MSLEDKFHLIVIVGRKKTVEYKVKLVDKQSLLDILEWETKNNPRSDVFALPSWDPSTLLRLPKKIVQVK